MRRYLNSILFYSIGLPGVLSFISFGLKKKRIGRGHGMAFSDVRKKSDEANENDISHIVTRFDALVQLHMQLATHGVEAGLGSWILIAVRTAVRNGSAIHTSLDLWDRTYREIDLFGHCIKEIGGL